MSTESSDLVPFAGSLKERARHWTELPDDQLKRASMKAANELDGQTLWHLLEAHLASFGRSGTRVSKHTLRSYRKGLEVYTSFASNHGINILHPTTSQAYSFVRDLEDGKASPSTIRVRVAAVRALYRALRWASATSDFPFADIHPAADPTAPWDKVAPYSAEEITSLLGATTRESDRVLVLLGAHAGLRISEAVALQWNDIDVASGEMLIKGKGRRQRRVLLSQTLVFELEQLEHKTERLFGYGDQEARRRLRQLTTRAGVPWRGFHALRHHAGTELYRATTSLDSVARHLGHANVETTRVYAKWADDQLRPVLQGW